jgi:glycosyltransferase involved in cell wall biosynthesis
MIRVLHIIPNLVKGGAQRIAIDICKELSTRSNVEVMLVYFEGDNEFSFLTKDLKVKKLSITFNLSFTSKSNIDLSSFENLLDEFQPTIIHSHLYFAELITREKTRANIQYITHCHDNIRQFRSFSLKTIWSKSNLVEYLEKRRLFNRYKKCNNQFIAISNNGYQFLQDELPNTLSAGVVLLNNAINLGYFKKKEKLGLSSEIKLINVGNFLENKNQKFLLEVIYLLRQKNKNYLITFVGDGETRKTVEEKARVLEIAHLVKFIGRTDNIQSVLNEHSIYVHSAFSEAFGLVLLEAMAVGLPVVSLDGKGNRDLIHNDVNGYLIPQGDVNQFVDRIIDLTNNPSCFSRIQQNGFETAKKYDIVPYCDRLIEIYINSKN